MKELFGLEHAVLVPDDDDSPRLGRSAGKAAADYMDGILKDGVPVAVAWGGTLLNFAAGVHERRI